ncbi:MAG: hypothetical protein JNK05_30510 [Myxococcales bacterium]|nr:hypothetical protein [Myxococcales bacterium]
MEPSRAEPSATASSKRGRRVVRVSVGAKPSRASISLSDDDVLIVWVYGSFSAVRLLVDGEPALEREVVEGDRVNGRVALSLDRPEFSRWTRYTEVEVDARHEAVDSPRGASSTGEWTRVATIVVRGGQARGMVLALCLSSLVFALGWAVVASFAASPLRRALDVAGVVFALGVWAIWFGAGGRRGARLALAWLVAFAALSAASLATTTIVYLDSYTSDSSALVPSGPSRWMRHEVRRTGDRVAIGRETFVAMLACRRRHDALDALRVVSGYESIARQRTAVIMEQTAAKLLMIGAPDDVDCVEPPWIQTRVSASVAAANVPDAQRYLVPTLIYDSRARIRASDLALGEPQLIRFRSSVLPSLELEQDRVPGLRLRFDRSFQPHAIGLWLGRLGAGWSGVATPETHTRSVAFRCSPGANSIVMLHSNANVVSRIESARFRLDFSSQFRAIACFDDPGDAFDRVTLVLGHGGLSPDGWRHVASGLLAEWKTTRLVLADDASETSLAEIYRPDDTLASEHGFEVVSLEGALMDATEIIWSNGTTRTVLWRRLGSRRVVVLLNVSAARMLDPAANSLVVRVGDGAAAAERRARLVRRAESYALIEVVPSIETP